MAVFLAAQLANKTTMRRYGVRLSSRIGRSSRFASTSCKLMHGRCIFGRATIIDKNGGLSNSTTYIGMILSKRIGTIILIRLARRP
jgi:hypothetical protein